MTSQFDIGFDTVKRLWFIEGSGSTRWKYSMLFVKGANIKLENVMCNTYSWADPRTERISHQRIRFYGENKIETHGDESIMDEINVQGKPNKFYFNEMFGETVIIKALLHSMEWELEIDGNKYVTKDIVGLYSATLMKEKLRMVLKNVRILYSNQITLINPELDLKKKSKKRKRKQ